MEENEEIRWVPAVNIPALEERLKELNKRAKKLKQEPMVLVLGATKSKLVKDPFGQEVARTYFAVTINGSSPIVEGGWRFAALITPVDSGENIVSVVPNQTIDPKWRDADPSHCDHCKMKRRRKDVFVLKNTNGDETIVGRSCLKDFLGHESADTLIAYAMFVGGFDLSEFEEDDWCESGGGPRRATAWDIEEFLSVASVVIAKIGFVSRTKAVAEDLMTTAGVVTEILKRSKLGLEVAKSINLDDEQERVGFAQTAKSALEWGKALQSPDDYLYNLGVASRCLYATPKTAGLLASLIPAYQRDGVAPTKKEDEIPQVHLGEVGKRDEFSALKITYMKSFNGEYGVSTLVKFDAGKGVLNWWASDSVDTEPYYSAYESGKEVTIKATVKRHSEYQGKPVTELTRVKLC